MSKIFHNEIKLFTHTDNRRDTYTPVRDKWERFNDDKSGDKQVTSFLPLPDLIIISNERI